MGFRSGLCDGYGLTDILFISNQGLVLICSATWSPICWKIKSLPHSFFPSFSRVRQISLTYADASSRPLTTLRLPTPLAAMHPHTWIFPPPFIAVGTIQSGWYRSPTLLLTTVLLPGISSKIDSSGNNIFAHCSDVQILPLPTPLQPLLFVGLCAQRLPHCNTALQPKLS